VEGRDEPGHDGELQVFLPSLSKFRAVFSKFFQRFFWRFCGISTGCKASEVQEALFQIFDRERCSAVARGHCAPAKTAVRRHGPEDACSVMEACYHNLCFSEEISTVARRPRTAGRRRSLNRLVKVLDVGSKANGAINLAGQTDHRALAQRLAMAVVSATRPHFRHAGTRRSNERSFGPGAGGLSSALMKAS
jgi:hypothetical protein